MKTFAKFKNEIRGLEDVKETVEAEEKISSSNIHFLFQREKAFKDYLETTEGLLSRISVFLNGNNGLFSSGNYLNKKILLVIAGRKGLVGDLWSEMAKKVKKTDKEYKKIIIAGDVLKEKTSSFNRNIVWLNNLSDIPERDDAKYVLEKVKEYSFLKNNKFLKIDILLPKVITFSNIEIQFEKLLPLKSEFSTLDFEKEIGFPIFEGKKKEIFDFLSHQYLELKILYMIWETKLAESLKRAILMEKANEEVKKQIKNLRYNFFRERRKILTKNQLEVFIGRKVAKI